MEEYGRTAHEDYYRSTRIYEFLNTLDEQQLAKELDFEISQRQENEQRKYYILL